MSLRQALLKPSCFYQYVDDTFVVWSCGLEKRKEFLALLNGIHEKIKFTMEVERGEKLPLLDIFVYQGVGIGSLELRVYWIYTVCQENWSI